MDICLRSIVPAVIGFVGIAILSAALFAARHGKALTAFAL